MVGIRRFVLGVLSTNCYLVENEDRRECVLIDLATYSSSIKEEIRNGALNPKAVLLTHGHFDHILGLEEFLKEFPVPVYSHEAEAALLADPELNLSFILGHRYAFTKAKYVTDQEVLKLAGMEFEVLYTPGHTLGSCCYYMKDENVLFSGDTLFNASFGRTNFPTGSEEKLMCSIKEKLFCLPEGTKVYPGHMEETTIGSEKSGLFFDLS